MDILIFALIVLVVAGLVVLAVQKLPIGAPFNNLIQVLVILIAALVIINAAGLI